MMIVDVPVKAAGKRIDLGEDTIRRLLRLGRIKGYRAIRWEETGLSPSMR
jgi:hypothetical protein